MERDAAHGVTLLRQAAEREPAVRSQAKAQARLAACYMTGEGVAANRAQALMWGQKVANGGDEFAFKMLQEHCGVPFAEDTLWKTAQ